MIIIRMFGIVSALVLFVGIAARPVIAQQASQRPITFIVPWPPGNNIDGPGRLLAANLDSRFGQKVIVENRVGAGGYTGTTYVARAVPNGQTLLVNAHGAMLANIWVKGLEVDMGRDLVPIAIIAQGEQFLMSSATVPARNLVEFAAYVKKNPKKLNAGVTSNTISGLNTMMFLQAAGLDMALIPYNSPPVAGLVTGEVHLFWTSVSAVTAPQVAAGKIIALAVVSTERSALMPEVPSIREQGFNFEAPLLTLAIYAPLGVSPELMGELNKKMYAAMNHPGAVKELANIGLHLPKAPQTPAELTAAFVREVSEMKERAALLGLKPQ